MHPNPVFRTASETKNLGFARERGFGTLTVSAATGPLLSHIPFLLEEAGASAELHLLRSNPIARTAVSGPVQAAIAVTGPDSYISPDWYGANDQVPTWNYVAVHLHGTLHALPIGEMHAVLDRLSDHFEARLEPKRPWTTDKMSSGVLERMMRAILPFRFEVEDVQGTWKLNQNKSPEARERAADHVAAYGIGSEVQLLSGLMHAVRKGISSS